MYVIKMENDKSLVTTVHSTIYQNENRADVIGFLLPKMYEEINLADCTVLLRYILPSGIGYSDILRMYPLPHNDRYYQYLLPVQSNFTKMVGEVELWITVTNYEKKVVLHTEPTHVKITEHTAIEDYLPFDDCNQIDDIAERMAALENSCVDNLEYDMEGETLQLTADGTPVGAAVDVSTMVNHDDVIHFGEKPNPAGDEDKVIYF